MPTWNANAARNCAKLIDLPSRYEPEYAKDCTANPEGFPNAHKNVRVTRKSLIHHW
jgi:hypothetical protein